MEYEFWADMCVVLHLIVIVYWVGGYFVPSRKFPRFVNFHRISGVVIFAVQCLMGLRCPLTMLEKYLRGIENPALITSEPFTIKFFKETFGMTIPDTALTIAIIIGTAICVITILARKANKAV